MKNRRTIHVLVLAAWLCCVSAYAQEQSIRNVPYRLTSESGEAIEMKVHYMDNYREVEGVSFDITVRKPDGAHQYRFAADEGHMVVVTLNVIENRVESFGIDTDYRPAEAAEASTRLTLHSRSGEGLYFIYEWEGAQLRNVRVDSERTTVK